MLLDSVAAVGYLSGQRQGERWISQGGRLITGWNIVLIITRHFIWDKNWQENLGGSLIQWLVVWTQDYSDHYVCRLILNRNVITWGFVSVSTGMFWSRNGYQDAVRHRDPKMMLIMMSKRRNKAVFKFQPVLHLQSRLFCHSLFRWWWWCPWCLANRIFLVIIAITTRRLNYFRFCALEPRWEIIRMTWRSVCREYISFYKEGGEDRQTEIEREVGKVNSSEWHESWSVPCLMPYASELLHFWIFKVSVVNLAV